MYDVRKEIEVTNDKLVNDHLKEIDDKIVQQYFDNFRELFLLFAERFKSSGESERHKIRADICSLNLLYAIQLKLEYELPEDLKEIAYDFDNSDYPRYDYIEEKILNNRYLLQTKI